MAAPGRILALVGKEFREVGRSPLLIALALLVPLLLKLLFGYGLTFDVDRIPLGVRDLDNTPRSREYVAALTSSGYFRLAVVARGEEELAVALHRGDIRVALEIPAGFARRAGEGTAQVQALVDGTFPNQANTVRAYLEAVNLRLREDLAPRRAALWGAPARADPVALRPWVWFNSELKSVNFIVPGLLVSTLMFYPALLSTLAVARERERGTILNIQASPAAGWEYLAGKRIPYVLISLVNFAALYAMARLLFGVPFRGSFTFLAVASVVYLLCTVEIGLLISLFVRTQVAAMLLTSVATLIPSFLYSGFFVPFSSMDLAAQVESYLFPARYFMVISRGTFLKGGGWGDLWPQLLALLGYFAALATATAFLIRKGVR